jgi:hypothetical protein
VLDSRLLAAKPLLLKPAIDGPSGVEILFVVLEDLADQHLGGLPIFGLASLSVLGDGPVALACDLPLEADVLLDLLQAVACAFGKRAKCFLGEIGQRGGLPGSVGATSTGIRVGFAAGVTLSRQA